MVDRFRPYYFDPIKLMGHDATMRQNREGGYVLASDYDAAEHEFKNFHRLLCERFCYPHDPVDWKRDQLSLIEHIARDYDGDCASPSEPAQDGWECQICGREHPKEHLQCFHTQRTKP